MSERAVNEDINVSHAYINLLHAAWQGVFASTNVLLQLGHPAGSAEALEGAKPTLTWLVERMQALVTGTPTLKAKDPKPSPDGARLLELFEANRKELNALLSPLERDLATIRTAPVNEAVALVIATMCRCAYSRDNYIRGLVAYGDAFNPEVADRWRQQLPSSREGVETAGGFFLMFQERRTLDAEHLFLLWNEACLLPFVLRAQLVDMLQVEAMRGIPLTFERLGIPAAAAKGWETVGMNVNHVSQWASQGFTAETAMEWVRAGVVNGLVAAGWRVRGFKVAEAVAWHNGGFSSMHAAACRYRGLVTPEAARAFLEKRQAA